MVAYLQRIIEVSNLTQVVQELVYSCFIVLDERVQLTHVRFLGVRWFVGEILEHLRDLLKRTVKQVHQTTNISRSSYQCQCSPRMLGRYTLNEHIRLRRYYSGIDEPQEEETANKGADGIVRGFWIFALYVGSLI